jgi:4-hydroxy-3-methylbut-2-en-1-yl diphosphate reductase
VEGQKYYRKGFKMRENIQHLLNRDYRSEVVDRLRENGNVFSTDGLTIRLADEFGFCYGVDRAVDYAFQTREKFPDKRIYITGDMTYAFSPRASTAVRMLSSIPWVPRTSSSSPPSARLWTG